MAAQTLPEITGHYATIEGTRVYYDQCGDTGPTMVCIHTAGACSLEYYTFIQIMATRGFTALALDLPGHGKSYPINWAATRRMHDYAEFVWKFAKHVSPREKPIICGSSIGGSMAVDIACHHSSEMLAALALEGGAYAAGEQFSSYCKWWEHPHAMPGWRDVMERAASSSLYNPPPERVRELRWQHRFCAQEVGTGDLQCWVNHDVRDKLKNISCPVLAFKGEADYWVPEDMLDSVVNGAPKGMAEKGIGPRMGHYPMFEEPELLADILIDFLQRRKVV